MSGLSKRTILEGLTKVKLVEIARRHGVAIAPSQPKAQIIAALALPGHDEFRALLLCLRKEDLQALCRVHGRVDGGSKEELADRLLGPQQRYLSIVARPETLAEEGPSYTPPRVKGRRRDRRSEPPRGELGFEQKLWQAADKLRSNMDAAEYKHVVLGLLFLKFISDAFVRQHEVLSNKPGQNPNDPKAYHDAGGFWVPPAARWPKVVARAHEPGAGATIDAAMAAIEAVNPPLRGVLPRRYSDPARPPLESRRLGELIQLVDGVERDPDRSRDLLGRVYEYFLTNFAAAEGRNGGQFYTPRCVVRLLIEMLAPVRGVIYDPACGSGGMFVQSDRFIREHGGDPDDLKIYGQESNPTTWRLAKMNLAIRGLACDLGRAHADSFHEDLHAGLRADYVIANPPFNLKDWGGDLLADDPRWRYGQPPIGNANFAWVQHFIHHLAPRGLAGFVLANGAMSTTTSGEGVIRQRIVEDDLVDCMVALPGQLFYSTQIPVSLWILARDKRDRRFRARAGEVLFIDARGLGKMVDRTHRTLTSEELERIAGTYHAFRGDPRARPYADVAGFCKVATIAEIARQDHVLTPGRYVGSSTTIPDAADFDERLEELRARLERHFAEAALLERKIQRFLQALKSRGA